MPLNDFLLKFTKGDFTSENGNFIGNMSQYKFLVNHVCFPFDCFDDYKEGYESLLLQLVAHVMGKYAFMFDASRENYQEIKRMMDNWKDIQSNEKLEGKLTQKQLSSLKENETSPLYLRAQNACIMVSRQKDHSYLISAFQASPKNHQVMTADSDLFGVYPAFTFKVVHEDILLSDNFGKQVEVLANEKLLHATAKKKGVELVEDRDVPEPKFVFEWIPAILVAHHSSVYRENEVQITKKLRDDIIINNFKAFRRSGMWTSIKVVLQLRLQELYGELDGKVLYKTLIALVIQHICQDSLDRFPLNSDIRLQIVKKLARRLYKLDLLAKQSQYKSIADEAIKLCSKTIESVNEVINDSFEKKVIAKSRIASAKVNFNRINISDINHGHLSALKNEITRLNSYMSLCDNSNRHGIYDNDSYRFNDSNLTAKALYEKECHIQDIQLENFVETNDVNSSFLLDFMEGYISKATDFYKNDPLGISRMVMTCIKIVCLLDKIATNEFPLLLEYKLDYDIEPFESLLIPRRTEMVECQKLSKYIKWRNRNARHESMLNSESVSQKSFGVKYAASNEPMQSVLKEIIEVAEHERLLKKEELEREREKHDELLAKVREMECTYVTTIFGENKHSQCCSKCSLQKRAESMRVGVHEWPLPEDHNLKNAIAFELLIPGSICHLRNGSHTLLTKVFGYKIEGEARCPGIWTNYNKVSKHAKHIKRYVTLGSSTKLFTETHYGSAHPTTVDSSFFVPNGYNVSLYEHNKKLLKYNRSMAFKDLCKFKASSPYANLQWTLVGTNHTENEVLASLSKCPKELSIKEYVKYGCLRAGHRLQMRNMLDALETRGLSFKHTAVVSLIAQTLWQIGDIDSIDQVKIFVEDNFVYPPSHSDFGDPNFILKLHVILFNYLKVNSKCWSDHLILLNIIIITSRAISLAPDEASRDVMINLMLECRKTLNEWIKDILATLSTSKTITETAIKDLKIKLFEISCCSILTFYSDKKHLSVLISNTDHVVDWLKAMKIINDNKIFCNSDNFRTNLFRRVNLCLLEAQNHITGVIFKTDSNSLTNFFNHQWADATSGDVAEWTLNSADGSYHANFTRKGDNRKIPIEIRLDGDFRIQGCPVGKLPQCVYGNEKFIQFFGATNFDVTPSSSGIGTFVTQKKKLKNNTDRCFTFLSVKNELIVKERIENGETQSEYLFLDKKLFKSIVPSNLSNNYSHWFNITKNTIEFKDNSYSHDGNDTVYYSLDLTSCLLNDLINDQCLVDIKSPTFAEIVTKITHRLELNDYVHIFNKSNQLFIELPRINLAFEVDLTNECVLSRDYRGMKVAESQKLDTLFGLEKGLLLCEDTQIGDGQNDKIKKQLLIPNGNIVFQQNTFYNEHHLINIDIETIKTPGFYSYDIDYYLKKLRAEESVNAWLYLAWLHATTSHVLPDPFLGLTGTEMSMELLQSANCWSAKPYDSDGIYILNQIAELSPKREFYAKNLMNIKWPKHIQRLAAHEAYQSIVQQLIKDSERLNFVFLENKNDKNPIIKKEEHHKLSSRAYHRNKYYYSNSARLNQNFEGALEGGNSPTLIFNTRFDFNTSEILNIRKITTNTHSPGRANLESFLLECKSSSNSLHGITGRKFESKTLSEWSNIADDFRNNWLDLYNHLRTTLNEQSRENQTMLLSFLAYKGVEMDKLLFLQMVSNNKELFKNANPPLHQSYAISYGFTYNKSKIDDLIKGSFVSSYEFKRDYEKKIDEMSYSYEARVTSLYEAARQESTRSIGQQVKSLWERYDGKQSLDTSGVKSNTKYINLSNLLHKINETFKNWFNNRELYHFIILVESTFEKIPRINSLDPLHFQMPRRNGNVHQNLDYSYNFDLKFENEEILEANAEFMECDDSTNTTPVQIVSKFPFENKDKQCNVRNYFLTSLEESWQCYHQNNIETNTLSMVNIQKDCLKSLNSNSEKIQSVWNLINKNLCPEDSVSKALINANIWPKVTPTNILKWFIGNVERNVSLDKRLLNLFERIAVLWSHEQRMIRCISYAKAGKSMETFLKKELFENQPFENWSPQNHPQWLVFSIEQNIMIRSVQVDVANHMINPPNNQNTVMQLNMGEGKTSVIIPLLVCALANGECVPRIVVLKPLFKMNYCALAQKLGSILNKRVYIFPCQRDIDYSAENIRLYRKIYEECQLYKGVVISLPEYQLSFKLKGLEIARQGTVNVELAKELIDTQVWINGNVRDILDESDELLNVKYQLVYPVGNNSVVDGGELRWLVAQAVLNLARNHFNELKHTFGDASIEYHQNTEYCQAYPKFRLLNDIPYSSLCEKICLDILKGKASELRFLELRDHEIEHVKNYVLNPVVNEISREFTCRLFPENSRGRQILLILRGYFTYNVFYVIFAKRWRVEYGVNEKRSDLLQAVPYRAKDVPAERAQFAHPDIAILLTQLSFYYSGLTTAQLDNVFDNLSKSIDPDSEYENWIKTLPAECDVHYSVKEYKGINLGHSQQKYEILYPLLKYHPKVVNYWLCNSLFPKEAKQFSDKLCTSAWDLAETKSFPITGFSGTNDSRLLLPLTTVYHEIPELKGTNGMLLNYLLLPENNYYVDLTIDCSAKNILERLASNTDHCRLLLDVGALMLELSNEQVVIEWLKLKPNAEAGVFFDNENNLFVIDRKGRKGKFEISPYKKQLEKCVIYFDESHTRGTDLKFPYGTIGVVTLGKGVTKDRLMQGCMRLRMLGHGHSVRFFASYEVHQQIMNNKIENIDPEPIRNLDILSWVLEVSRKQIVDGFLYWSIQGLSYYRRESIFEDYKTNNTMKSYANNTLEHDLIELIKLYDGDRLEAKVVNVVENKRVAFLNNLKSLNSNSHYFENNSMGLKLKMDEYVTNERTFTHQLEEEQELELEIEQEEEKELERPPPARPAQNRLDQDVINLVKNGRFSKDSTTFLRLTQSLQNTSLKHLLQHEALSDRLFTTQDFAKTVQGFSELDAYLRPPRWLCVLGRDEDISIIVLSAYEANELFAYFKPNTASLVTLLPRCREEQERMISFPHVSIPSNLIEQLSTFAGSLYFNTKNEQNEFNNFIGYCPSPRTELQQSLFQKGLIEKNGYVYPEHREQVFGKPAQELSKFHNDPNGFLTKLYEIRNYSILPKESDVLNILRSGRKRKHV